MKRLQFRHNNTIWENRGAALKYFEDIAMLNSDSIESMERSKSFGESLYAEPMVAKYLDEEGNEQIILAIGVNSGKTSYHLIDSKQISELISANTDAINAEIERALAAEEALNNAIIEEVERAKEAELSLSGAIKTERDERIAADASLQAQITENIAKIVPVTENLGANVREEYVLKNAKGEELGSHIKIYKDSALVGAEVNWKGATGVTQDENGKLIFSYSEEMDKSVEYLYLVYRNENGGLSLVGLDFEKFLMEEEIGDGIKLVGQKFTINIKSGEKYLNVTENGLQTINIDEAIETAVDTLSKEIHAKVDAEIERSTAADEYISGLTAEFSASTVNEFSLVNSLINAEIERSVSKDEEIDAEIANIKEFNNTLNNKVDVEIVRSKNEDENFRIQIEHITTDLATEISNRELANASIRGEFAAADIALGSRIDTEAEIRNASDNTLSERIDDEAEIRSAADALLTTTLNETSERLAVVEGDYLKQSDKNDVLNAVSAVQITAINATNAAVSAQTTADEAKSKIDGFMAAAEIGGAAIDTLIELQNYIKADGTAAAEMLNAIAENKEAIIVEVERAKNAEKTLEDAINAEAIARTESANILSAALSTEITRAMGAENVNATAIANEIKRANDVEAALQTALTTEINNRESADNAIRGDFAAADESLKTRIAAEELARQTSYDALNTRIDNEATARASAVAALTTEITNGDKAVRDSYEAADAVLQGAIQSEIKNREDADADIISKIDTERASRETAISEIKDNIAALSEKVSVEEQVRESKDNELNTKIETLSGNVVTSISNVVNEINNKKVNDVVYDGGNNVIKLIFADGSYSEGFDASEFVVDGMLDNVSFDNNTNEIKFVWNTSAGKTEFIVPLDKFVDQYTIADDSVSFLKISDDNTISAIVDNADGFVNTLASTNFVQTSVENAQQVLSANTHNSLVEISEHVNTLNNDVDELSANTIDNIKRIDNNIDAVSEKVNNLSGSVITYVDNADNVLSNKIDETNAKLDILNGKGTGSIKYLVDKEISTVIVYGGAPITMTSPEEAKNVKSLARLILAGDELRYFVSNDAEDIDILVNGEKVSLAKHIATYENRIETLENQVKALQEEMLNIEERIKNVVKSYVVGTENEIKVVEENNNLKVGFDDNAIFGFTE